MAETLFNRYTFAHANLSTKNIEFKSGSQANLNALIASGTATEGTFYLTTDTHRLYIGREVTAETTGYGTGAVTTPVSGGSKTIPIPINEGIATVDTIQDLNQVNANQGEFYYVAGPNILAVRSGAQWVQLNPDTNTNDTIKVTGLTISNGSLSNGTITCTYTLTQQQTSITGNITNLPDITGSFTISADAIADLVSVGIQSSAPSSGAVTVSLTGDNADSTHTISLSGSQGVSLGTSTANSVVIKGTTYSIASPAVENATSTNTSDINLTDSNSGSSGVAIKTGANLAIDDTVADEITIKHIAPTVGSNPTYYGNNTAGSVGAGGTIKVPKITKDDNGHISSISDVSLTIPTAVKNSTLTVGPYDGSLTLTETDSSSISSGQILYYTATVDGSSTTWYNQANIGSFYTAGKTDELIEEALQGMNAMVYKGTVGTAASTLGTDTLPDGSTNQKVSIGDTYAVNANNQTIITGTNTSGTYQAGDLFIATSSDGTETDGYIPQAKLQWTYIPAGNIDTQYRMVHGTETDGQDNPIGVTYTLQNTSGSAPSSSATIKLLNGTDITVSSNATNKTATFNHANSGVTAGYYGTASTTDADFNTDLTAATLSSSGSFKVPLFKVNARGHVTLAGTKTYTLPASNNLTFTLSQSTSISSSKASVSLTDSNSGDRGKAYFGVGTDGGLTISADANGIYYSHIKPTITTPTEPSTASDIPAGGMTVVTGITRDTYGHVTGYTLGKYAVPAAVTYSLAQDAFASNTMKFYVKNSNQAVMGNKIAVTSDTLTLSADSIAGQDTYKVDLVWGSF